MNKTTILIVEDEAIVAADLSGRLRRLGYEVTGIAAEGQEAVALASRFRPHLVLMDISLSGSMDGIEAAEAIHRESDVPVIYLTAHSDPATLSRAKLTGPFGYILKPFEERELATQIELALYKHQAERQIREQREWFRVALTSIGDAVIATDASGRITFLNPVAESLTGWKVEEAMGTDAHIVFRIVNEQTGEAMEEPVARVLRDGGSVVLENHSALVARDGRTIPIEDSAAPILDAEGRVIGVVLVFRDVTEKRRAAEALRKSHDELDRKVKERTRELTETNRELNREIEERKRVEKAIRESEEKYRIMIKLLPSIVYKGFKDWSVEFFDEKMESLTGYGADEFNSGNMKWRDVILKEDLPVLKEYFIRAQKADNIFVREYRIQARSGKILWIQDRGHIVYDDHGEFAYISGIFFDITELKIQEEEVRKTRNLIQTLFNGVPDPLVLLDESLKMRILNHAAIRYYQTDKSAPVNNLCCYEGLLGRSAPCEGCRVPELVARRKSGSFERQGVMNPDKIDQVTLYRFDEKDHNIGGALMHIRDITEAKLMERKMIQNEKLAALGLTISSITHEIANPVSVITFNAPILKDYLGAMASIADKYAEDLQDLELFHMSYPEFKKDALEILENILHASNKISNTISGLRRFVSDKKQPQKTWFNVKPVIERVVALFRFEIINHVKVFEVNYSEDLPEIYSDPDTVEQILVNLLMNAAQAADKEDSRIILDAAKGNSWKDHLVLKISDNGCGMDQETLSKIFNPFFTTKAPGQGTGLGLYICQNLVKDLGGRIEVQSEPGKGSVFSVILNGIERRSVRRL